MTSRRIITILASLAVLALLAALIIWLVFPQWRNTPVTWLPLIAAAVLGGLGAIKLIADVSNARAWHSRGVSRARLGDQAQAIADYTPAIDAGLNGSCPLTDQRGLSRPIDGDLDGVAECDIGAYEYFPVLVLLYLPLAIR